MSNLSSQSEANSNLTEQNLPRVEIVIPEPPTVIPSPPVSLGPVAPLSIHIAKDAETQVIKITGLTDEDRPNLKAISAHIEKQYVRDLKPYLTYSTRNIEGVIKATEATIPYQAWADAIGAAVLQQRANIMGASFQSHQLDDAYIALGGEDPRIYKLSPVKIVKTNKALSMVKKLAEDSLQRSIAATKANAEAHIDGLLRAARGQLHDAQIVANLARVEAAKKPATPPSWTTSSGTRVRLRGSIWEAGFVVNVAVTYIEVNIYSERLGRNRVFRWDLVNPAPPIRYLFWVPFREDGSYSFSAIHLDESWNLLPHVNHSSSCMVLGDAPTTITNPKELESLASSVRRCMQGIQMDSLYTAPESWDRQLLESLPTDVLAALEAGGFEPVASLAKKLDSQLPVDEDTEEEYVWQTR